MQTLAVLLCLAADPGATRGREIATPEIGDRGPERGETEIETGIAGTAHPETTEEAGLALETGGGKTGHPTGIPAAGTAVGLIPEIDEVTETDEVVPEINEAIPKIDEVALIPEIGNEAGLIPKNADGDLDHEKEDTEVKVKNSNLENTGTYTYIHASLLAAEHKHSL